MVRLRGARPVLGFDGPACDVEGETFRDTGAEACLGMLCSRIRGTDPMELLWEVVGSDD
jgi:hypothetical protein